MQARNIDILALIRNKKVKKAEQRTCLFQVKIPNLWFWVSSLPVNLPKSMHSLGAGKKVYCIPSQKLNSASLLSYFCTEIPLIWETIPAQPSGQFNFSWALYNTQQMVCVFRDAGAVTCETHLRSSVTGGVSSGSLLLFPPSTESFLSPTPGLSE